MIKDSQKASTSLLLLLIVLGVIVFLIIANISPIKDNFLGQIYPKPSSQAATSDEVEIANSTVFEEAWADRASIAENWQLEENNCQSEPSKNGFDCQNLKATFKKTFSENKNLILSGGFKTDPNSETRIGLESQGQVVSELASSKGSVDSHTLNKDKLGQNSQLLGTVKQGEINTFKLVYAKDKDGSVYVYYYLNNGDTPLQKIAVSQIADLTPFVSCKDSCKLDNLKIVGQAN